MKKFLLLTVLLSISLVGAQSTDIPLHFCSWEDCEHNGEYMIPINFHSSWGYEPDQIGYFTEFTHFIMPSLSYEQCETYINFIAALTLPVEDDTEDSKPCPY